MREKIAFIGVGNMGNPMAENLLKAGNKIKVFDVSKQMLEKAKEKNLETVDSLENLINDEISFFTVFLVYHIFTGNINDRFRKIIIKV